MILKVLLGVRPSISPRQHKVCFIKKRHCFPFAKADLTITRLRFVPTLQPPLMAVPPLTRGGATALAHWNPELQASPIVLQVVAIRRCTFCSNPDTLLLAHLRCCRLLRYMIIQRVCCDCCTFRSLGGSNCPDRAAGLSGPRTNGHLGVRNRLA